MIATTVICADGLSFTWAHATRQEAAFALCSLLTEMTEKTDYARYTVCVSSVVWRADEEDPRRTTPAPDARSSPFDNEYRPQNSVSNRYPNREHYK